MLNFASLIILISGQNPTILAGRREGGKPLRIAFVVKFPFCSSRHGQKKSRENTKEDLRRMTRERKKRKRRERRLHKENALLSALSEDLRLNVAEILQSIELAPETRRSCKEEINC